MEIVIIEDEKLTAEDLADVLGEIDPDIRIRKFVHSVKQGIAYFSTAPAPDLVFCDIQLGDGLSFEIFDHVDVKAPVIFCTAYDEYAIDAFRTNGIAYILKPFSKESVTTALDKYRNLTQVLSGGAQTEVIRRLYEERAPKAESILVYRKERIIPVKLSEVALLYIEHQQTYLLGFDGKSHPVNKTLDQLEELCGDRFFRASRQHLVNRDAVKDAAHHLSRRFSVVLKVPYEGQITVSKEKLTAFLDWLTQSRMQ